MTEILAGRYELGDLLGAGGMARVVEAIDRVLDRAVAVKLLRDDLAADRLIRERFLREARAAASLSHPSAVAVYDAGIDGDRSFLVMELIDGPSLTQVIAARGALEPAEAAAIVDQVLAALGAAHRNGLVHRDVKPGNILLTGDGQAKLADFGIAKSVLDDTGLTLTGQLLGTPQYLSPEQATGGPATPQSDLYAAGIVLYELLAGAPPFHGEHPLSVALAHSREAPPPLPARRPQLDERLVAVVARAMSKDPADRFADADAFRGALAAAAGSSAGTPHADPSPTLPLGAETRRLEPISRGGGGAPPRITALAVASLLVLGVLALNGFGDASVPAGAPEAGSATSVPAPREADSVEASAPATAAATPEAEPQAPPQDLDSLVALLAEDPGAHGEKGADLLQRLEKVMDERGRKQHEEARETIDQIQEWVEEDELDASTGARAVALLEPLAGPEGRGGGERDDEDDDDD